MVIGRETADGIRNGLPGIAGVIGMSMLFGYIAMSAKDMAKGREPRTFDPKMDWEHNSAIVFDAMLQGGGLGLYGDLLFGKFAAYGSSPIDSLAGPTFGGASNVIQALSKVKAGDVDGAGTDAVNMLARNIPGGNLFYVQAALNYMIVYQMQEMANPGYLRRMESRLRKEGQEMFIPPSREIPTGGGNRLFEGIR